MGPELSMEKSLCQSFPEFISKKKRWKALKGQNTVALNLVSWEVVD